MKTKYVIRETSVKATGGNKPFYFHGFVRGRDVTLVFGTNQAQEYDSLESVRVMLTRVKEISGRDTWAIEEKMVTCKNCGSAMIAHVISDGELYCPTPTPGLFFWDPK